jgi:hypothetical protein
VIRAFRLKAPTDLTADDLEVMKAVLDQVAITKTAAAAGVPATLFWRGGVKDCDVGLGQGTQQRSNPRTQRWADACSFPKTPRETRCEHEGVKAAELR